jgi:stage V sporulation protein SpoVS
LRAAEIADHIAVAAYQRVEQAIEIEAVGASSADRDVVAVAAVQGIDPPPPVKTSLPSPPYKRLLPLLP